MSISIDKQIVLVDLALEVFRDLRTVEWPLLEQENQTYSISSVRHRYNAVCDALDILASGLRQEKTHEPDEIR